MIRLFVALGVLVGAAGVALAKCPPGTKYQCYQGLNGKVVCGCF